MRSIAVIGSLLLSASALCACHGPVPSQRLGLKPLTSRGPYRSRLADYKLRGESRPAPRTPAAESTPRARTASNNTNARARRGRRGQVQLRPVDLEPIHRWFSAANSQFILGDEVEIVASKEFFSQVLTMNAQVGLIRKAQKDVGSDKVITLTYIGKGVPSALNSPRIFISGRVQGLPPAAGFTATARKRITVRLSKTDRPDQPVRVQVIAKGDAARGRHDEILQRDDVLGIRGALRWDAKQRRWVWQCG